ncbi:MAG: 4Fe-4S dicluster domain-containing protein, partial [Candidatus Omnitrophica bacterium]|nr:4Fe-4S dicluster domain-containing protein [Candidatus Omnitrophota bacterium]
MSDNNSITILLDKCVGCTLCVKACPFGAIHMANKKAVIDMAKCTLCGACIPVCKFNAIEIRKEAGEKKDLFSYKDVWVFCEQKKG